MEKHSITGKWRGNYQYDRRPDDGCSFDATFSEESGRLQGTIVDDYAPCEAFAAGNFSFPTLQFTKVYRTGEAVQRIEERNGQIFVVNEDYANAVEYEGTMDNDGQAMSGTWSLKLAGRIDTGTWAAHRISKEERTTETEKERRIKVMQPEQQNR